MAGYTDEQYSVIIRDHIHTIDSPLRYIRTNTMLLKSNIPRPRPRSKPRLQLIDFLREQCRLAIRVMMLESLPPQRIARQPPLLLRQPLLFLSISQRVGNHLPASIIAIERIRPVSTYKTRRPVAVGEGLVHGVAEGGAGDGSVGEEIDDCLFLWIGVG